MKDVFILGAGFSSAISESVLPTMDKLTIDILTKIEGLDDSIYKRILEKFINKNNMVNIEDILTFLYQDYPWKTEDERSLLYSLYIFINKTMALYFEDKEKDTLIIRNKKLIESTPKNGVIPSKLIDPNLVKFIRAIHKNKVNLITFNYDTVFDDVCRMVIDIYSNLKKIKKITCDHFYKMPLMRLYKIHRSGYDLFGEFEETLTLNKLHGSINWYHYGEDSDQIFLTSGFFREIEEVSKAALIPLIIPPVYDKSGFLKINAIRSIWIRARKHLEEADRVFFIGYSLPKSDLTVRLMLKVSIKPKTEVFIIDNNFNAIDLIKANYKEVIKNKNGINVDYIKSGNVVSEFMGRYTEEFY